jgi:hypothetical protein
MQGSSSADCDVETAAEQESQSDCLLSCSGDFAEHVNCLGKASTILKRGDIDMVAKLATVGIQYMRAQAQASCNEAGSRPLLHIYSADLTPMLMKSRHSTTSASESIHRESSKPVEWNLHRSYFVWRDDDEKFVVKTMFEAPVAMSSKKHGTAMLLRVACCQRCFSGTRTVSIFRDTFSTAVPARPSHGSFVGVT